MPGRANMIAIADWLKVRVEWLAHGEGAMRLGDDAPPPSDRVALGVALFNKATPRSQGVIDRIATLEAQGKLTDEDLQILEKIIDRFGTAK